MNVRSHASNSLTTRLRRALFGASALCILLGSSGPPRQVMACGGGYERTPEEAALAAVRAAVAKSSTRSLSTGAVTVEGRSAVANFRWIDSSESKFVIVTARTLRSGERTFTVVTRDADPRMDSLAFETADRELLSLVQAKLDAAPQTLNGFRAMGGTPSARVFVFERFETRAGTAEVALGDDGWSVTTLDLALRNEG